MGDEHSGSEGHRDEQSGLKQHEGHGDMSDPMQNNMEGVRDEPLGSKPQRGPEVSNRARNAMVGVSSVSKSSWQLVQRLATGLDRN